MNTQRSLFPLSARSESRRREILQTAQRALRSRVRRRAVAQAAALVALVSVVAVAAVNIRRAPIPGPGSPVSVPAPIMVRFVPTDPGVLERLRLATAPMPETVRIGDEELEGLMAEAGVRGGIIRVEGRFVHSADLHAESPAEPDTGRDPR